MALQLCIKKEIKRGEQSLFRLDLDIHANAGVTIIFGPSGAGKSMTLRTIAGLETPDSGTIVIGDRVLFDSAKGINVAVQKRRVGYIFQDYALFPHMTARENILYGLSRTFSQKRVDELFDLLGIEHTRDRYPRVLSGGEKQRVAIGRALASDPAILLLDEPLSAIDEASRTRLLKELKELQQATGVPFVYVTHNSREAIEIGNYAFLLKDGKIIDHGTPSNVIK
jgi:molybdate transport system ATP-binding protein